MFLINVTHIGVMHGVNTNALNRFLKINREKVHFFALEETQE